MSQTARAGNESVSGFSCTHQVFLVLLRVLIGWHFLYEGYLKLSVEGWSAAGYLNNARGPLAGFFKELAQSGRGLSLVDQLNIWGLTLVGGFLMLGLFSRLSSVVGVFFLAMFYLSNPPWPGVSPVPGEGSYLIVNKNLIELCALLVLAAIPTGRIAGLDLLLHNWLRRAEGSDSSAQTSAA